MVARNRKLIKNEWLFDAIWALSDKSYDAGLPEVSMKLEDAMDTFLAEHQLVQPPSKKATRAKNREKAAKERAGRRLRPVLEELSIGVTPKPETAPGFVSSRPVRFRTTRTAD